MRFIKRISIPTAYIIFLVLLDFALILKVVYSRSPSNNVYQKKTEVLSAGNVLSPTSISTLAPEPLPTHTSTPLPTEKPSTTPFTQITNLASKNIEPTTSSQFSPSLTATPQPQTSQNNEILNALNSYRQKKGVGTLSVDSNLQSFAQNRAEYFDSHGGMDSHAGFQEMMNNNGFEKMGFNSLGENSSYGSYGSSTNLIEGIYAGDGPHDQNQLNPEWTHVGIGVKNDSTDLVFGGRKR